MILVYLRRNVAAQEGLCTLAFGLWFFAFYPNAAHSRHNGIHEKRKYQSPKTLFLF